MASLRSTGTYIAEYGFEFEFPRSWSNTLPTRSHGLKICPQEFISFIEGPLLIILTLFIILLFETPLSQQRDVILSRLD